MAPHGTKDYTRVTDSTEYLVDAIHYCAGGEEREEERGSAIKTRMDGGWDAHGWPAQARNGGCPVKALAVVSFGG